ncbi:hypothetical protein ACIRQO_36690 [Streptomyces anulatus]
MTTLMTATGPAVADSGANQAPPVRMFKASEVASPGWDYVGTSEFYRDHGTTIPWYKSKPKKSTGGDFRTCITSASTRNQTYILVEADPGGNNNDQVGAWTGAAGCLVWRDIGEYVDGSNRRAEFYINTEDVDAMRVKSYD